MLQKTEGNLRGRNEGGFEQNSLYICMEFTDNKNTYNKIRKFLKIDTHTPHIFYLSSSCFHMKRYFLCVF